MLVESHQTTLKEIAIGHTKIATIGTVILHQTKEPGTLTTTKQYALKDKAIIFKNIIIRNAQKHSKHKTKTTKNQMLKQTKIRKTTT